MRELYEFLPHLRDEHLPLVRKWAELEVIRRAAFAGIVQCSEKSGSIVTIDLKTREISVKRLVDDHRKLVMSQVVLERELLMTPASRAQLSAEEEPTDLVALMARAAQADAATEPVEPAEPSESDPS